MGRALADRVERWKMRLLSWHFIFWSIIAKETRWRLVKVPLRKYNWVHMRGVWSMGDRYYWAGDMMA